MEFIDTHCHIQSAGNTVGERSTRSLWAKDPNVSLDTILSSAAEAGVSKMICVGCEVEDSKLAVEVARGHDQLYASIGIHPHEAQLFMDNTEALEEFAALATQDKVVAVGECGLDYFYEHSSKEQQVRILELQLELASKHNLPVIFHVREAFDDFWPIFDKFSGIRGVLHSFTDSEENLRQAVKRGLFIGVNGIATFAKQEHQRAMYRAIPLEKLLLETDAPFLTPVPFRGKICEPKHIALTAEFLGILRGETTSEIAQAATQNALTLFNL